VSKISEVVGVILCRLGLHVFEEEPSHKELVKNEGVDLMFWTKGIQKGTRFCTRKSCKIKQGVYREGWVGTGGNADGWKNLRSDKEAYIDSLPVL
jgi:hypothetical protein